MPLPNPKPSKCCAKRAVDHVYRTADTELPYRATGEVNPNGTAALITGATVTRFAVGRYNVVFTVPADNANYPVILTAQGLGSRDDYSLDYVNQTVNGFQVRVAEQDNGGSAGVYRDLGFSFFVPNIPA